MKTSLMGDPSLEIAGKRNELNQAGAGLAKTRFDMTAAMPVDNAFGESFEGMANDMGKTRGWKYVLQQAFRGLGAGAKSAANKEKMAKLENIASGMSFFEGQNKALQQDIDGIEKKQQMKAKIEPYALSAMELSYSGQPYDVVNDKMRNLFDQVQLNNPEIRGKYIGFVPNSPLLNIRDENGKDAVISLASIAGEEKTKRIQGDWIERRKLDAQQQGLQLQQQGLGIQQQNANINQDYLNLEKEKATGENGTSEADKLFLQESTKAAAKDAAEYRKNIRQDYEEAQKLEQVSKDIKEALKAGAFTNEGSASRVKAFLGLAAGGKGATATQMLQQAAGNLIPKIKDAFGGRVTNTDLEFAEEFMLPGSKISKASNEKFLQGLDRLIQKKKSQYTNLENIADENGGMLPRDYLSRLRKIEESNNVQQSNMGQQEDKVLVKTPQGVGYISREQYNALKQ